MDKIINDRFGFGVKIFLYILLIALLLVSCKSTQSSISLREKSDSIVQNDIIKNTTGSITVKKDNSIKDQSITTDNQTKKVTEVEFSFPDSSGKQRILRITTTTITNNSRKDANVVSEQKTTVVDANKTVSSDKSKVSSTSEIGVNSNQKSVIKTPEFITLSVIIVVVSLLVFLFLFLKTKRII